jgi:hypothetical protein
LDEETGQRHCLKEFMRSSMRQLNATTIVLLLLCAVGAAGCKRQSEVVQTAVPVDDSKRPPLRILLVDSPELVSPLEIRWQTTSQQKLEITNITVDELLDKSVLDSDLIIYPAMLLGELVKREQILSMPPKIADIARNGSGAEEIVKWPSHWVRSSTYGRKMWGVVLGAPLPMVIRPPSEESSPFVIESLSKLAAPNSESKPANDNMTDDNSWLVDRFLVFLAAEKKDSNQLGWFFQLADMSPRLQDGEFESAAEKFILASKSQGLYWRQPMASAWDAVRRGELSWTLGYPRANLDNSATAVAGNEFVVGVYGDTVPAKKRDEDNDSISVIATFDSGRGLMASLAATNRQSAASTYFLEWLNNENQRVAFSGVTERVSSLRENAVATQGPEEAIHRATLAALEQSIPNELRFASAHRYRNRLQAMLEAVLANPDALKNELFKCNQDFDKITEELGRATMRNSIEKSLLLAE